MNDAVEAAIRDANVASLRAELLQAQSRLALLIAGGDTFASDAQLARLAALRMELRRALDGSSRSPL